MEISGFEENRLGFSFVLSHGRTVFFQAELLPKEDVFPAPVAGRPHSLKVG